MALRSSAAVRWSIGAWLIVLLAAAVAIAAAPASDLQPELHTLLARDFRFSSSDVADLEKGKVVTHRLGATAAGEIAAVGAVRVKARKEAFVNRYRDIVQFKRGADVVQIGRFGSPPTLEDLAPLTIDKQDVDVRTCRVGNCDIRLPAETIARFQREINWKGRDADERAATLFKEVLLDNVRAYLSGGPGRIVQYDDDKRPVRPVDDFVGLLKSSPYIGELVPGLQNHLRTFPLNPLPGAEDFLYWSKEKFGLTPFITVTHVTITHPTPASFVIVSKDVYSSRYFDASLSLTIASEAVGAPDAFYLVYVNRSRANALKGTMSGLRRAIVERRAKGSLDENLKSTKSRLEKTF
jgi:hypothetical protein